MREFIGHFSPGPQYDLPGIMGGATGNYTGATQRLLNNSAAATGHRVTLSSADLAGRPVLNTTPGSHADATRQGSTVAASQSTNFWRSATMRQPGERIYPQPAGGKQTWYESASGLAQTKVQDELKASLAERWRAMPKKPFRMTTDMMADPPLACNFGSGNCRTDCEARRQPNRPRTGHPPTEQCSTRTTRRRSPRARTHPLTDGAVGGCDLQWRESKIQGYQSSAAPRIAKPSAGGPLRYAFVQTMGTNSVPRGTACADFDGGRITQYKVRRPNSPLPGERQTLMSSSASAAELRTPDWQR